MMDMVIYTKPEDLPHHLQHRCMPVGATGWHIFHHPFCVTPFPLAFPVPIEEILEIRASKADEARQAREFGDYLFRLERPYRLEALLDLVQDGAFDQAPAEAWSLARTLWMDSEIDDSDPVWGAILGMDIPGSEAFMTEEEHAAMVGLPDPVLLWRGISGPDEDSALDACLAGHSWSFDREIAVKFANRNRLSDSRGWVASMEIPKADIVACLLGRGESEIIVRPSRASMRDIVLEPAPRRGDDFGPLQLF